MSEQLSSYGWLDEMSESLHSTVYATTTSAFATSGTMRSFTSLMLAIGGLLLGSGTAAMVLACSDREHG